MADERSAPLGAFWLHPLIRLIAEVTLRHNDNGNLE